ncbi:hypothetical protein [Spartinivicinus marinus]|nr:hypothetical protein [Spartinivicinus marinus]MCX4027190.1 hypothetical protein [Spartinivicinus marinus]
MKVEKVEKVEIEASKNGFEKANALDFHLTNSRYRTALIDHG